MNESPNWISRSARTRWLPVAIIAVTLTVLAAVIVLTTLWLRESIRRQIAGRDGEVLYAVALMHYAEDVEQGVDGPIGEAGNQLSIALKSAQLRGVLGVRLFDAKGRFAESFPPDVIESTLPKGTLADLDQLRPVSRFRPNVQLWEVFYPDERVAKAAAIPLLEVTVPLHSTDKSLAGIAQFLVAGEGIAIEYARLDQRLVWQALTAFGVGGLVLSVTLAVAFQRLNRANRLLAERTEVLARANQELVLAAKTSALGAVTAHLIHGLKNPLAGLESFVSTRPPASQQETDWEQAVATTRRMQAMINQVVGVLREDQSSAAYDVTLGELEQMVRCRVQPLASERGVSFTALIRAKGALPNRVANLLALILINLTENAVQATPRGKTVTLIAAQRDGRWVFEVRDEGAGFPGDVPLFQPCRSTKEGGTGIGLALCKQLANHVGAELRLAASTTSGCVFELSLPPLAEVPKPRAESVGL